MYGFTEKKSTVTDITCVTQFYLHGDAEGLWSSEPQSFTFKLEQFGLSHALISLLKTICRIVANLSNIGNLNQIALLALVYRRALILAPCYFCFSLMIWHIRSNKLLYADDLKIFSANEFESVSDSIKKNSDIQNVEKCWVVSYCRWHTVSSVGCFRDLGVIFNSKFTFTQHVLDLCSKASTVLGLIAR